MASLTSPATTPAGVLTTANHIINATSPTSFHQTNIMVAPLRFLLKVASFGYLDINLLQLSNNITNAPSTVPDTMAASVTNATEAIAATVASSIGDALTSTVATAATTQPPPNTGFTGSRPGEGLRSIGNIFSFVTSKWAVLCLFMTILLNRTTIYASLRRPITLPLRVRLIIRTIPLLLFFHQILHILFSMRCQTSVDFRGTSTPAPPTDWLYHTIGRAGSFWLSDRDVCEIVGMIPDDEWIDLASTIKNASHPEIEIGPPRGSLEILWPLYKTLSFSQFVEGFSCAMMGRATGTETGMTLLEHSLAFAEAEALSSRKVYRLELAPAPDDPPGTPHQTFKIKGNPIVPVEVLYICLISSLSHVTSHLLAIFQLQSRFRLISTGFFGLAFLAGFAFSLFVGGTQAVLEFPTVSVVGFIPHLLIFAGIAVCSTIYTLALLLTSLFPPGPERRRSFSAGFANLRANLTLSSVNISMAEDFYTTLLKLGFMTLMAAGEATYLNEGRPVRIPGLTWLESERRKLLDSHRTLMWGGGVPRLEEEEGDGSVVMNPKTASGPYARERKDLKGMVGRGEKMGGTGGGRWAGAGGVLRGLGVVVARLGVVGVSRALGLRETEPEVGRSGGEQGWDDASAQLHREGSLVPEEDDEEEVYYRFLRSGTPLPEIDNSGDFIPPPSSSHRSRRRRQTPSRFTRASSVLSTTSTSSYTSSDSEGGLTETESSHHHRSHRTPDFSEIFTDPSHLARLLDPQSPEDRHTARLLARRLTTEGPLTRRRYSRAVQSTPLTAEQEESTLEDVIMSRRPNGGLGEDWGSEKGEGGGPVCVVCQSAPRTIIVWPCRCLSLCEDCRVCLAMNNFVNCVTCRQRSEGFSRIYVP